MWKKSAKWLPKNVKWLHLGKKTKSKRVIWLQHVWKCSKWLHFGKKNNKVETPYFGYIWPPLGYILATCFFLGRLFYGNMATFFYPSRHTVVFFFCFFFFYSFQSKLRRFSSFFLCVFCFVFWFVYLFVLETHFRWIGWGFSFKIFDWF